MGEINFEAKTDRELLLLTAQKVNDITEIELPLVRTEIKEIQKQMADDRKWRECVTKKIQKPFNFVNTKFLTIVGGTGLIIGTAVYELGRRFGWWE